MEETNILTVSASPHQRKRRTTKTIMLDVIIALLPALAASVWFFGPRTLLVTGVSVLSCVLFEFVARKIMKRPNTIWDLSAVVTGILLAFNLPSNMPLEMVVVGAFVSIIVIKQFFGGIGDNFVNPALGGRIVLMLSFSKNMSSFPAPFAWKNHLDAITQATPLSKMSSVYKAQNIKAAMDVAEFPNLYKLLVGERGGVLGETCAVAILIGFVYLLIRKTVKPTIPFVFVGTVAVIMFAFSKGNFMFTVVQLLSGGLLLGAVFMATDYATSPETPRGRVIFAIGCGLIASLIRLYGNMPEGVSFAIFIMNIFVPLIENSTHYKPFGEVRESKEKEEAAK